MRLKLITMGLIMALAGCASEGDRTLFDRLEFDEDECGNFEMTGSVDTNTSPFFSSNVYVSLTKKKECDDGV